MGQRIKAADLVIALSLVLIFALLIVLRPPFIFYTLLLIPIALAAFFHEFVGGTLVALGVMIAAALLLALDPVPTRRAYTLQEGWPVLIALLALGPILGLLVARDRDRERQLESAAKRLHVVQDIVRAINTSPDPEDSLTAIIAETRRLIPFERAAILLRTDDLLRVVASSIDVGEDDTESSLTGRAYQLEESAAGIAIKQHKIWTGGPQEVRNYPDTDQLCPVSQTCLIIPLQFQQQVIGVFSLAGENLEQISDSDRDNLTQIVDQTAIAIEHARLYRLERERAKALAAISEAGREIAASLNVERTLQLVIEKAAETLPMDAGVLFVFDEGSQLYRVAVSYNLPPEQVEGITFAFNEGVPGWVVQHEQPLIINDAAADSRVHPYVVEQNVKCVLAIPLITRERMLGVLNLFCQTATNAFDEEALRLGQVYADQAAIFIENARLVEELRQAAAELEARVEQRTQELRETQDQVIRAEKMAAVGRLAGSVAHEVNNPLQAIALHLQLIADENLSDPGIQELGVVQQELDRIAAIVQRLLEFQRPKHGRQTVQEIPFLVEDVLALSGKQLQQADVAVNLEIEDRLAPVKASGDQLKQVFLNLILNAVEAMPDGGQLKIQVYKGNGHIFIRFEDTGAGVEPEAMKHLFEPFFSTKHTGSGIGLAVSEEIIARHGGALVVESAPEQGAVFTVKLPVYQERETEQVTVS
jgi:two-component system NtrC family sensor kinase